MSKGKLNGYFSQEVMEILQNFQKIDNSFAIEDTSCFISTIGDKENKKLNFMAYYDTEHVEEKYRLPKLLIYDMNSFLGLLKYFDHSAEVEFFDNYLVIEQGNEKSMFMYSSQKVVKSNVINREQILKVSERCHVRVAFTRDQLSRFYRMGNVLKNDLVVFSYSNETQKLMAKLTNSKKLHTGNNDYEYIYDNEEFKVVDVKDDVEVILGFDKFMLLLQEDYVMNLVSGKMATFSARDGKLKYVIAAKKDN